ncbi:MAG: sugar ABC transporter ATP-binding protein [Gaiellaceae bacterium]|jgi:ABC-type sugar transport system ATPase subunit
MSEIALEFRSISKAYGGSQALRNVSWSVASGEIHAVVGANGAGKSTLIKILAGAVQPDAGRVFKSGRPLDSRTPAAARRAGVSTVYQELSLLPDLSVAQNIVAGSLPTSRGFIDRRRMTRDVGAVLEQLGLRVDPGTRIADLSLPQQQIVEIARALSTGGDVLVLDEPNSSLSFEETDVLLTIIRTLADQGMTVIFVSHRLEEVFVIADRITVLRDGAIQGTWRAAETDMSSVINAMAGEPELLRERTPRSRDANADLATPTLALKDVSARHVGPVSLAFYPGEIVGLVGLEGSGIEIVLRAAAGAVPYRGTIKVGGAPIHVRRPGDAIAYGIVFLPPERKTEGLWLEDSLEKNVVSGTLGSVTKLGVIRPKAIRRYAVDWLERVAVHVPDSRIPVAALSGGNQQRILFAKCLAMRPKVFLLSDPTRGIDVRAKAEIHALIRAAASEGRAVAVASSEFDEMLSLADRLVCMRSGKVVAEGPAAQFTKRRLLELVGTKL